MKHDFRLLKAEEIEVRVGQVMRGKATLLLYKDARCDMAILDELYDGRWQRDHKEVKGNMYAGVGVWDEELMQWIWRWDCGVESNTEKEKGEASDAFKRACVNLGIGRELYTAPLIMVDAETEPDGQRQKLKNKYQFAGCKVQSIAYGDDRKINSLVITDRNGNTIFNFGKKTTAKKSTSKAKEPAEVPSPTNTRPILPSEAQDLRTLAEKAGSEILKICNAYKVQAVEEMTSAQYEDCKRKLEYKISKKENKE